MRDPKQAQKIDKIMLLLRDCWIENNDLRLFQLMISAMKLAGVGPGTSGDYFYVEDTALELALTEFEKKAAELRGK
jgi:hypothetical protein